MFIMRGLVLHWIVAIWVVLLKPDVLGRHGIWIWSLHLVLVLILIWNLCLWNPYADVGHILVVTFKSWMC